jgi:hypothetical protein
VRAGRGLPSETPALLREAKEQLRAVNTAMLHGEGPRPHLERLDAIAGHLPGFADIHDANEYLSGVLAAPNGTSPLWWGQPANFVLTTQGCRSWVEVPGCLAANFGTFMLHAVDYDRPWFTRSGFLNRMRVCRRCRWWSRSMSAGRSPIGGWCTSPAAGRRRQSGR